MKAINFINSIPPKTRSAVHLWIQLSAVAFSCTCIALIAIYMHAHYQYQTLCATCQKLQISKNQMLNFLQDKRSLKEQELLLKEQQTKITHTHEKQKKITQLIELLAQPNNNSVVLHNLEVTKQQVTMILQANSSEDIIAHVAQLEQHALFANVTLQSMTNHDGHMQATLNATIV